MAHPNSIIYDQLFVFPEGFAPKHFYQTKHFVIDE